MQNNPPKKHLLTVLVEDYFHVGAFERLIQQRNWSNFEPRCERNTHKTLDLLDSTNTKATFFVLGWIARQNPKLIREIVSRGHEVASRGFYHRSLKNLTYDEFREDLRKASHALEDACGQKIVGYRSAEKINFEKDSWIFDVLAEEGFAYDASFLPTRKDNRNKRFAHQIHTNGKAIWEFPYSTRNMALGLLPISGGNYFRQIPYTLMRRLVNDWTNKYNEPFLMYFHVWELDAEQPRINAASKVNQIRHYRKLDKMEWIIRENLQKYEFTSVSSFLGLESQVQSPKSNVQSPIAAIRTPQTNIENRSVSVVIPCYNEESVLPYLANTLRSVESEFTDCGYTPSFIFVDDCSNDNTFNLLHELFGTNTDVTIIKHDKNQGVAAGIMTGLREAKTEIVCSMDCDCSYDPHELVRMIPLLTDEIDMVTASPYHRNGSTGNVPGWRLFLSKCASFLYARMLHTKLSTYTSCFRVYRKSSVINLPIKEKGFLGVAEMLGKLDLSGGKILEFPTALEVRLFGFSKMKTARTILGHLKLLSKLSKQRFFRRNQVLKTAEARTK